MNEMVERVALVIRKAADGHETLEAPLDYTGESAPDLWRENAREVIAAMREPTWPMIDAGNEHDASSYIWKAMIDEALKAPSPAS
jgi:hypothetical protein